MLDKLFQKQNNLFQNSPWLSFQKSLGRNIIDFPINNCHGIKITLPLRKSFIWIQKSPQKFDLTEILKIGKQEGTVFIRIEPQEKPKAGLVVTKKSLLSGQKSPEATQVLDISIPEAEILAGMKPKTRYNIRLAEKKGVKVRISTEEKDLDIFYDLLLKTQSKDKGYHPFPKSYYQKMVRDLGPNGILKIVIAEYNNEPLAAILVSFCGEVATYLHGGSSENYKNLMAPYLCQWVAIKEAKKQGAILYDFWGVAKTDDPKDPWAGITRFKEGFGGEKIIFAGAYDLVVSKPWYTVFSLLAKTRKVFR